MGRRIRMEITLAEHGTTARLHDRSVERPIGFRGGSSRRRTIRPYRAQREEKKGQGPARRRAIAEPVHRDAPSPSRMNETVLKRPLLPATELDFPCSRALPLLQA